MSSIYSEEYQTILKLLRKARIDKGITQAFLAEKLGKPQSFVAKVENGERRIDVVEFIYIAKILEIDPIKIIKNVS